MRLIDADRFYINYARWFSREPVKVEIFKQFIDSEPTVCDIEQIRADIEAARYGLINDGLDVALRIVDKPIEGR